MKTMYYSLNVGLYTKNIINQLSNHLLSTIMNTFTTHQNDEPHWLMRWKKTDNLGFPKMRKWLENKQNDEIKTKKEKGFTTKKKALDQLLVMTTLVSQFGRELLTSGTTSGPVRGLYLYTRKRKFIHNIIKIHFQFKSSLRYVDDAYHFIQFFL